MGNEIVRISGMTETSAVEILAESPISMSVQDVLKWICPEAPPNEAMKFLFVCRSAKVNPLLGEAHLVPMGGKWATIIDKSGWLKRVEVHPQFDGFEAGIIVRERDPKSGALGKISDVEGSFLPPDHIVVGGWAKVHRKDRSIPVISRVSIMEYKKNTPTWNSLTSTMIRKVALVNALRESGLIVSGCYDATELASRDEDDYPSAPKIATKPAEAIDVEYEVHDVRLPEEMVRKLAAAIDAVGMTEYDVQMMLGKRGVTRIDELNEVQATDILSKLENLYEQIHAGEILLPDPEKKEGENPDGQVADQEDAEEDAEDVAEAEEELDKINRGEVTTFPWEEVKKNLNLGPAENDRPIAANPAEIEDVVIADQPRRGKRTKTVNV